MAPGADMDGDIGAKPPRASAASLVGKMAAASAAAAARYFKLMFTLLRCAYERAGVGRDSRQYETGEWTVSVRLKMPGDRIRARGGNTTQRRSHFSAIAETPFCHWHSPFPPLAAPTVLAHFKR
jgi:hypothetical protein